MERTRFLLVVGATLKVPGREKEFNEWYNKNHIPMLLKIPGVASGTRYKLTRQMPSYQSNFETNMKKYPQYLALYELDGEAALEAWEKDKGRILAREHTDQQWGKRDEKGGRPTFDDWGHVLYELISSQKAKEMDRTRFLLVVGTTLKVPEREKEFNEWYNKVHIPVFLKIPGVISGSRYKLTRQMPSYRSNFEMNMRKYPQYLALYELDGEAALEAWEKDEEHILAREDTDRRWGKGDEKGNPTYDRWGHVLYELVSFPKSSGR